MAREFIDFKEKYEDLMKWSMKQTGRVLQDNEDFDPDELYGICTVALKKAMDLSSAAMDLVEYQTNCLEKIKLETAKAAGERDSIRVYLMSLDTKLDGINEKLDRKEKAEKKDK